MAKRKVLSLLTIFLILLAAIYSFDFLQTNIFAEDNEAIVNDSGEGEEGHDEGNAQKGKAGDHGFGAAGKKGNPDLTLAEGEKGGESGKGPDGSKGSDGSKGQDGSKGRGGGNTSDDPKGQYGGGGPDSLEPEGRVTLIVKVVFSGGNLAGSGEEVNVTIVKEGDVPVSVTQETQATDGLEAVFIIEPSGIYSITGSAVPGYTIPEATLSLVEEEDATEEENEGDVEIVRDYEITLEYQAEDFPVEEITLDKSELILLENVDIETLTATIVPANANNQEITWVVDPSDLNIINESEVEATHTKNISITPENPGTVTITATNSEGIASEPCTVNVVTVDGFNVAEIDAIAGQLVYLPTEVETNLSNENFATTQKLPITWWEYEDINTGETVKIEDANFVFQVPQTDQSSITLYGVIYEDLGYVNERAELTINIASAGNDVITLDKIELNLEIDPLADPVTIPSTLTATVTPPEGVDANVVWTESSNGSIITVEPVEDNPFQAIVTAVAPGNAYVTATVGDYQAYCLVTVTYTPEVDLIYTERQIGTTDVYERLDSYDTKEEIEINVENLINAMKISAATYYVKVEQKGNNRDLGIIGEVIIGTDTENSERFNLYEETLFEKTDNYSNEYFVSMSRDPNFPKGDDDDGNAYTLMTNFKIDTAVPTVPQDLIEVTVEMVGGDRSSAGIKVLLCRVLDEADIGGTDWDDYLDWSRINMSDMSNLINDPYTHEDQLIFTDEVKMYGTVNDEGIVEWENPRETLKLGGYLLLEVTPKGYINNLNSLTDDGTLLKEVHLDRVNPFSEPITRHIINTYIW